MKSARGLLLAAAVVAIGLWSANPGAGQAKSSEKGKGTLVRLGGVDSRTPADWHEEKPTSSMRLYQFRLSPIGDDKDDAEIVIFYFGPGQGGSVADNIKRWKGSFVPPQGKTIQDVSKVEKIKVGDIPVTSLDIHGTYSFRFPPFSPNAKTTLRPNYRMLGVIFEGKKGPYFIRVVGPEHTVAYYKKGFAEWLKGFK